MKKNTLLLCALMAMVIFTIWAVWQITSGEDIDDAIALPSFSGDANDDVADATGEARDANDIPCLGGGGWLGNGYYYDDVVSRAGDRFCGSLGSGYWCWNEDKSAVAHQEFVGGETLDAFGTRDGGPTIRACFAIVRSYENSVSHVSDDDAQLTLTTKEMLSRTRNNGKLVIDEALLRSTGFPNREVLQCYRDNTGLHYGSAGFDRRWLSDMKELEQRQVDTCGWANFRP